MKKVSISFENDKVKVVFTEKKGGKIWVNDFLVLDRHSLKEFLKTDKTRQFYVTGSFAETVNEVVTVPALRGKSLLEFIKRELKKRYPDIDDFIVRYNIINEKDSDGAKTKEVLITAFPVDKVDDLLYDFIQNKKDVPQFQPDILSMFNILPAIDSPALVLFIQEQIRIMFFIYENNIYMVRKITGISNEIDDFDIQNINMTVNYCRQNLRLEPELLFVVGKQRITSNLFPLIPVATLLLKDIEFPKTAQYKPEADEGSLEKEDIRNMLTLPLSAQFRPKLGNFLSPSYALYRSVKKYFNLAIPVFALIILVILLLTFNTGRDILSYERKIKALKERTGDITAIFKELRTLEEKKGDIIYLNSLIKSSSFRENPNRLISVLSNSDLSGVDIRIIKIHSVNRNSNHVNTEMKMEFTLEGISKGSSFGEVMKNYNNFLNSLKEDAETTIDYETLDVEKRNFTIRGILKI